MKRVEIILMVSAMTWLRSGLVGRVGRGAVGGHAKEARGYEHFQ